MQQDNERGDDGMSRESLAVIHEKARLHLESTNPAVDQTAFMRAREEEMPCSCRKRP